MYPGVVAGVGGGVVGGDGVPVNMCIRVMLMEVVVMLLMLVLLLAVYIICITHVIFWS